MDAREKGQKFGNAVPRCAIDVSYEKLLDDVQAVRKRAADNIAPQDLPLTQAEARSAPAPRALPYQDAIEVLLRQNYLTRLPTEPFGKRVDSAFQSEGGLIYLTRRETKAVRGVKPDGSC